MLLVVSYEFGCFQSDLLKDVVDERVHDAHGFLGDTGFWVDLFQDSVDVYREGLCSLFVVSSFGMDFLCSLGWGGWHDELVFLLNLF